MGLNLSFQELCFPHVRARVLQEFVFFAVTSVTCGEGFASTP